MKKSPSIFGLKIATRTPSFITDGSYALASKGLEFILPFIMVEGVSAEGAPLSGGAWTAIALGGAFFGGCVWYGVRKCCQGRTNGTEYQAQADDGKDIENQDSAAETAGKSFIYCLENCLG